jgi:hypothetical protein
MTDTHTAETDYHHEVNAPPQQDVPASLTINPPKPHPHVPRGWPLGARLTVAVLIIALAAGFTMSLISLHNVSGKAAQASQQAAAEAASVASLGQQLARLQARVAIPAPVFHLPAIYQHYGFCVSFSRNTGNGDLVDVNLTAPQVAAGSYTCGQGNFVSVIPGG